MAKTLISSKRRYVVTGFEEGSTQPVVLELTLEHLITKDPDGTELLYTLQEELDSILDLNVNESLFITMSRDRGGKGVIKRVQ